MRWLPGALALGLWLGLAYDSRAHAQDAFVPGTTGDWILGGGIDASYEDSAAQPPVRGGIAPFTYSRLGLSLWPGALFFPVDGFGVGAAVVLGLQRYDEDVFVLREYPVGADALLAYRVRLAAPAFLLPSISLGAVHVEHDVNWRTNTNTYTYDLYRTIPLRNTLAVSFSDRTQLRATLALPLAFGLSRGIFVGFGPSVEFAYALSGSATPGGDKIAIILGLRTQLGVWLEASSVEAAPVKEPPAKAAPVEESPAKAAPVEESQVEEAPAKEAPAKEAPVEASPVEEPPVEESPVEESPIEAAPVEESPTGSPP